MMTKINLLIILALLPLAWAALYCPAEKDLVVAYGNNNGEPQLYNRGWTIKAGGGVATKASFNLLGGWISYNADWSGVPTGVNANIYSISPRFDGSYTSKMYCDGQPATSTKPWCVEVDWIESDGNCGGASTLHTWRGADNSGGCGGWGCGVDYNYGGEASFKMNISFETTGHMTVRYGNKVIGNLSPTPGANDWSSIVSAYSSEGAVVYSTQWVGWVPPAPGCSTSNGDLNAAKMSISNLQISGKVVQGPTPSGC